MVHPAASAGATFQVAIDKGKFQGTMPAMTPTGCFAVYAKNSPVGMRGTETSSVWPVILVAQPAM
jgi:hypothetical protein